ncbi:helix-turn-helix transcriptional regulator [Burkholderia sp. LMG 13014]|uniref:helix-turn-helix domain-containing protein n=1 Tax=Burkholderia sp. LMG 13014 TaxID=2709306 RepID=UPI0019623866|nr:helix-turn-helix transcriptional regulator [Burkholderia sp. LMG 13014]
MDWKTIIADCLATGLSQADIARQIGVTQSAISHVVKGNQRGFLYEPGRKLIELHERLMARKGGIDASDDVQPPAGTPDRKEGD